MKSFRVIVALALFTLALIFTATPAFACGNAMERMKERELTQEQRELRKKQRNFRYRKHTADTSTGDVVAASERPARHTAVVHQAVVDLNAGRNAAVIVNLYEHFGYKPNQWALNARYVSEAEREIVYVLSIAILRSEGRIERFPELTTSTPKRARDNIKWAIRAMEGLAFVGYASQRHVAEAWGRDPELQQAAIDKLKNLNARGQLRSEFQLKLLARLLRERGDHEGADAIVIKT